MSHPDRTSVSRWVRLRSLAVGKYKAVQLSIDGTTFPIRTIKGNAIDSKNVNGAFVSGVAACRAFASAAAIAAVRLSSAGLNGSKPSSSGVIVLRSISSWAGPLPQSGGSATGAEDVETAAELASPLRGAIAALTLAWMLVSVLGVVGVWIITAHLQLPCSPQSV
jgi:hypothetical protein